MDDITIENIVKLDAQEGDVLLVTLPQPYPDDIVKKILENIQTLLADKQVKVLVVPPGTKVELIRTSELENNNNE